MGSRLLTLITAATLFSCTSGISDYQKRYEKAKNTCNDLWYKAFDLAKKINDSDMENKLLNSRFCFGYSLYESEQDINTLRNYLRRNKK